ncbi:MAG TPA: arsenate reductase ArsC [Nitrososphaeraceae archaeon]|jgi:arsenate reductase (thioredoxin)|nr:arsenate reductase ArsC [Nitrososphaeraceae archaeon]
MKLSFGKSKLKSEKTILFVCVENAGRSQMAEGFFNKNAPEGYRAISAGTKPVSQINPVVIEVMKEVGIDISNQKSKEITEDMMRNSFKTVNMGCMVKESCPTLFLPNVLDWNLEDPKGKSVEKVTELRDQIDQRVKELVAGLTTNQ